MTLEITIQTEANVAKRIMLSGTLDTDTAPQLQAEIDTGVSDQDKIVILDLENLEFLSSAGVQVVFKLRKSVTANDGEFFLVNMQPQIEKVFEIIKALDKMDLGVFKNIEEMDAYLIQIQNRMKDQN